MGEKRPVYNQKRRRTEIAHRIREARTQRGLTQTNLAQRIGCSRIKMNRVEQGRADLTALELDRLAYSLKISVIYFFSTDDNKLANDECLGQSQKL